MGASAGIFGYAALLLLPIVPVKAIGVPAHSSLSNLRHASPHSSRRATCSGTFRNISAQEFVTALNPGWNLGNTLDAPEYEGVWNNPPVVEVTFDDARKAGFNSVRLPVTWHYHVTGKSPDWTVDPKWLQRVSDVVDMTLKRGFYTIVNVHHDSWIWADVTKADANITMIEEKFYRLWLQIGQTLGCKSERLAFEPINEPPGTTAEHGAEINRLNEIFLRAINDAGGFNAKRVVTLSGAGQDGAKTSNWFKLPTGNFSNPIAIQYHYYSPYDFIFGAWGKTIWGSSADKQALESDLAAVRGNFSNIPLLIGEWEATTTHIEAGARWNYFDFFVRTAAKYNTSTILWDNGLGFLDRAAHRWRDETAIQIYMNAYKGMSNSLPYTTTDGASLSQNSSAYVYRRTGEPLTDQRLPFVLNGNILENIRYNNKTLIVDVDFAFQPDTVVLKPSFLSTIFSSASGPGTKGELIATFNEGANLRIQAVEWDTPILAVTSLKAVTGADIHIPITWKGLDRVAAVKAIKSDGTILVDDWTQWLPALQQGRLTYNSHYNWNETSLTLTSDLLSKVVAGGKATTLSFEFFPRQPSNVVNVTLTV